MYTFGKNPFVFKKNPAKILINPFVLKKSRTLFPMSEVPLDFLGPIDSKSLFGLKSEENIAKNMILQIKKLSSNMIKVKTPKYAIHFMKCITQDPGGGGVFHFQLYRGAQSNE